MNENEQVLIALPSIETNRVDYVVAGLKSLFGPVPLVGSLVAEVIGAVIPNQRIDRIARYISILEQKVAILEQKQIAVKFSNPGFIDLFEDSLYQAARALTDERLQHIATVVKNGISDEQQEYDQYKYLLWLLAEISDTEMIILQSYLYDTFSEESEFHSKYRNILMAAGQAHFGSSQEEADRSTIHKGYRQHLSQLGLLRSRFKKPKKNEIPEFDTDTGMIKASGYELTALGRLLLRQLDIASNQNDLS